MADAFSIVSVDDCQAFCEATDRLPCTIFEWCRKTRLSSERLILMYDSNGHCRLDSTLYSCRTPQGCKYRVSVGALKIVSSTDGYEFKL